MKFVGQARGQACGVVRRPLVLRDACRCGGWGSLGPRPLSLSVAAAPAVFLLGEEAVVQKRCPIFVMGDPGLTFIFRSNVRVKDVFT